MLRRSFISLDSALSAENDVVHRVYRVFFRSAAVGRGVCHNIAANGDVKLVAFKHLMQPLQIIGICDIDRNIIGENMHMEFICDRHTYYLPADKMRLSFLRPRKFIDCEEHLKSQIADCVYDSLMRKGEGVESSGEEGYLIALLKAEIAMVQPMQRYESVNIGECRRAIEEGKLIAGVLAHQK